MIIAEQVATLGIVTLELLLHSSLGFFQKSTTKVESPGYKYTIMSAPNRSGADVTRTTLFLAKRGINIQPVRSAVVTAEKPAAV